MITTNISWCSHTWSPWRGCEHAKLPDGSEHPGCLNCYAEALSKRNPKSLGEWGSDGKRVLNASWDAPRRWSKIAEASGERHRIFPSLCDPFEDWRGPIHRAIGSLAMVERDGYDEPHDVEMVPATMERVRRDFFQLIDTTPALDWLLLTKRPQNVLKMWPTPEAISAHVEKWIEDRMYPESYRDIPHIKRRNNIWLILSASTQADLDANMPALLACRCLVPVLGLSLEPLLGPVNITPYIDESYCTRPNASVNWVIVGGESGSHFRPCPELAIEGVVEQCRDSGVAVWCKQDSGRFPGKQGRLPDKIWNVKEFPELHSRD